MALVPVAASTYGSLVELEDVGNSVESLVKLVDSQGELFHSQIDQLRKIVVTQCTLSGANPLSQEMAAGALSIKIGKRPRELLNPKAIKYMQSLFSIKDTIGKKETREISAICGITATQVRDYFTSQRSKVRKLVRLSQEKATSCKSSKATIASEETIASKATITSEEIIVSKAAIESDETVVSKATIDGCSSSHNQSVPARKDALTNVSGHRVVENCPQIPGNLEDVTSVCTQSAGSPVDINSACKYIVGNSNIFTGTLGYTQFFGSPVNITTPCGEILAHMQNITPLCMQAPGNLGNVSTERSAVLGNLENVSTVCTLIPANLGIISTPFTSISGNLGNVSVVCTPAVSGYSGPVDSVGTFVPGNLINVTPVQNGQLVTPKTNHNPAEEGPSNSMQEESTPGVDSDDKKFLENIFNLMRKEQTFSGRVKLMEWVLQIHNSAVLSWFSTKGGITILASWLSEAATEEQTTVLLVIFKVLCHLPLKKAQPEQMSAILQSVNKLRFYRNSDISNRAKFLLSRWSKMFVRSQALRNSKLNNGQKEMLQKQRTNGVLDDKSWPSKLDIPEDILAFAKSAEDNRETEPNQALNLLTESGNGSIRKQDRTVSATKMKERRRVLLVEQLDGKVGRSGSVARAAPSNASRPMSADDIQKAKIRASFMQDKYGKSNTTSNENAQNSPWKAEDHKAPSASQGNNSLPVSKTPLLPTRNEVKQSLVPTTKNLPNKTETSRNPKRNLTYQGRLLEKLKRAQIPWRRPPEIKLNAAWRVCEGQNSKEVQVQTQRNQREKETIYQNPQEIPPNPKEPWDVEMDFDDSLTPQIPTDPPPEPDSPVVSPTQNFTNAPAAFDNPPSTSNTEAVEPDAELLVVLLKNPEVVEALTKGEGKNLNQEQMVALLDMVKKAGTGAAGVLNGLASSSTRDPEPEPVSLPSPTPPSNASRNGWRSEFAAGNNRGAPIVPTLSLPSPSNVVVPMGVNHHHNVAPMVVNSNHIPMNVSSLHQLTVTVNPPSQQHLPLMYLPHQLIRTPETQIPSNIYLPHQQIRTPETQMPSNMYVVNNPGPLNPPPPPIHSEPAGADYWTNGPNGNDPAKNLNCYPNRNNYNTNSHNMYPRRNDFVPESRTSVNSQELYGQNYYSEPRREFDQSREWSRQRQWNHDRQRDHHQYRGGGSGSGGGRWRHDNDRDYR